MVSLQEVYGSLAKRVELESSSSSLLHTLRGITGSAYYTVSRLSRPLLLENGHTNCCNSTDCCHG